MYMYVALNTCSYYVEPTVIIIIVVVVYSCEYIHGDLCDMCQRYCLNPFDDTQQKGSI